MQVSNAQIRFIRSLQQKKFRKLHNSFVVEGSKIVSEMLHGPYKIKQIFALEDWLSVYNRQIPATTQTLVVSPAILSRISGLSTANQVLAVVVMPDRFSAQQHDIAVENISLYLDDIQDPGNLGTIIRTADWFGIKSIYCSSDTVDVYNPKVIQASMGSFSRVRTIYGKLPEIIDSLEKKPHIYGAALEGDDLFETPLSIPAIVVIGNESQGISDSLSNVIDNYIRIPGASASRHSAHHSGLPDRAESLNASVAASIIMAWFKSERSPLKQHTDKHEQLYKT